MNDVVTRKELKEPKDKIIIKNVMTYNQVNKMKKEKAREIILSINKEASTYLVDVTRKTTIVK